MTRLCRIYRRCRRFHHSCCSPRCRQDTYSERQLQLASRRYDHHQGDDQAGRSWIILQGINTKGELRVRIWLMYQILVVGPKLVFSYTLAQSLIPFFGKYGELLIAHVVISANLVV